MVFLETLNRYSHSVAEDLSEVIHDSCSNPEYELVSANITYLDISDLWIHIDNMFTVLDGIKTIDEKHIMGYVIAENLFSMTAIYINDDIVRHSEERIETIENYLYNIEKDLSTAGWRESVDYRINGGVDESVVVDEMMAKIEHIIRLSGLDDSSVVAGWGPMSRDNRYTNIAMMHSISVDEGNEDE